MQRRTQPVADSKTEPGVSLREKLGVVSDTCTECGICREECAFLRKYGFPKEIAEGYDALRNADQDMPFECSLCALCTAVCPSGVDPAGLFMEMRRETVRRGGGDFPEHKILTGYERRGTSRTYSWYGLPRECDTVFFPGCALSGTRSDKVIRVYQILGETIPSLGIVLDCCTKPSHDLGREDHFKAMFEEMRDYLAAHGVRNILVACPNCYRVFAEYGGSLSAKSIYEILPPQDVPAGKRRAQTVTIHDPCSVRFEDGLHAAVRVLLTGMGTSVEEMTHSARRTMCCGEGGGVGLLEKGLADTWGMLRQKEASAGQVVAYCAGCAGTLSRFTPTVHLLDLLFEPEAGHKAKAGVAKPPFTYWKRLRLKRWFRKNVPAAVTRERTFRGKEERKTGVTVKFVLFLFLMAGIVAAVKGIDASLFLDQQALRTWIEGYGVLAPVIYIAVYTVAPALFLPGLPITVVGGILFGPFWGVVYTIIGATLGASVAFLVSRYLARDWVGERLKGPRWRRLDEEVGKHGWKVVAFTRLIPLFPFNLLNYAFGLTKISLSVYAAVTFITMLPACIAFIVFSSSLLDLVRGKVSFSFVVGLLLIVLVSFIPIIYRRMKAKKPEGEPFS